MSGSTSIDPSIALRAGQGVTPIANPLTTMGQFMQLRQLQQNNALFPGQQQIQGQTITSNDLANQQAQLGLTRASNTAINGYLGPAVAKGANATLPDFIDALGRAQGAGFNVDSAIADLHSIGSDPAALAAWGKARLGAGLSPSELLTTSAEAPATRNVGGQIINGSVSGPLSPTPGIFTPAGQPSRMTMTPEAKATQVPTMGSNGQAGTVPLGSRVDQYGDALPAPGQAPGRYPQPPSTNPPGFIPTGLPAGAPASVDAYNAAQHDIPEAVNRVAGLQKAYSALSAINSGPGTGTWQQIRSTLQSLPVINGLAKPNFGDEDTIANYDSARKYMQDYANRSTVGSTAQGLQASQHANASTDISQGAAADVLRTNIGLERMAMAQTKAAQNPQTYLGDSANFASKNDRRAFAADMYSPTQLKSLVNSMKPAERAKFMSSLAVAKNSGMLQVGQ